MKKRDAFRDRSGWSSRCVLVEAGEEAVEDFLAADLAFVGGVVALTLQGGAACPYANICEHCPNFRTDAASQAVLSAQRVDAAALAADATARGWDDEADRHRRLVTRLDTLIATQADAG